MYDPKMTLLWADFDPPVIYLALLLCAYQSQSLAFVCTSLLMRGELVQFGIKGLSLWG